MFWNEDYKENGEIPYFYYDIVQYIVDTYTLVNAANYSNKRKKISLNYIEFSLSQNADFAL